MSKEERRADVTEAPGAIDRDRIASLARATVQSLKLDLTGRVVVTEAATGAYSVTAVIAAMAGSPRVIALTRDSRFGSVDDATRQTLALANHCGVSGRIEIHADRRAEWFERGDIITNLGFVRPLDAATCAWIRPGAVIPLMCEAWEWRPADLDLQFCLDKGISVFGTSEDHPRVGVFDYCGWLALKLLFDAGFEGHKLQVLVVGPDNFSRVISDRLSSAGIRVRHIARLEKDAVLEAVDAVIVADYHHTGFVIGPGGQMESADFVEALGRVTVIPFVGQVDVPGLQAAGVSVFPPENVGSHRMVRTLAALGPRPVIELHAAGLKVGSLALTRETDAPGEFHGLAQAMLAQLPQRPRS